MACTYASIFIIVHPHPAACPIQRLPIVIRILQLTPSMLAVIFTLHRHSHHRHEGSTSLVIMRHLSAYWTPTEEIILPANWSCPLNQIITQVIPRLALFYSYETALKPFLQATAGLEFDQTTRIGPSRKTQIKKKRANESGRNR